MDPHFSSKDLSQDQRETIARELFTITKKKGDELIGLCPFHDDATPSFGYNTQKDLFNCLTCDDAAGDLIDLWSRVHSHDKKSGYKAFCEQFQTPRSTGSAKKKKSPPKTRKKEKHAIDVPAKIIPEKSWDALPALPLNWLKRCIDKFGWSADIITKFDIRLSIAKKTEPSTARLAIPVRDDEGRLRNIRMYLPNASPKDDKVISWGSGYGSGRLFPTPSFWVSSPIYLCEGEKDTLCAISHGLNAVTQTCGVKSWKSEYNHHFEGMDVIICYDADKPGLVNAEKRGRDLVKVAKSVRIIQWPEFMPYAEKHGEDLTDFFVKHQKTVADLKDLLAEAITITKPAEPEDDEGYKRFLRKNGKKFLPMLLAQAIMQDVEIVSDPDTENIYRWNGKYWEEYKISYLRSKALVMLGDEGSSSKAADAAAIVRDLSILKHSRKMNDQPDWVCLQNGMFNIQTRQLSSFDKNYYSSYMIDIDYDPQYSQECSRWEKFLEETIESGEVIIEIQKFFGYCLTRETRYEKALIMIGPGGDGKSKLLDVLQAMVGEENCSSVKMSALDDQFYVSMLADKLINVSTEIENKVFGSDVFKAIVSGDRISASFKNQTPFTFRPYCKLAFSSNKYPRIRDNSDGFFRKIMVVELKEQFSMKGTDDKFLIEKLLAELSGIFAWALDGLSLLQTVGFDNPKALKETLRDYKVSNNPVLGFIDDCVVIQNQSDDKIQKNVVYKAYKNYCRDSNYRPLGIHQFGKELNNQIRNLRTGRKNIEGREWCYIGIRLTDAALPLPSSSWPDSNKEEKENGA